MNQSEPFLCILVVRGGSMSSQNSIENEDVKKSKKTKSFDKLSSIANDIAGQLMLYIHPVNQSVCIKPTYFLLYFLQ